MGNSSSFTAAVAAIDAGDLSFFQSLHDQALVQAQDAEGGWTLLHYATSHGRPEIVRHLLEARGADPNKADEFGQVPLHAAAMANDLVSMQLLLDHGAEPRVVDRQQQSPLDLATMHGSVACAKCLLPYHLHEVTEQGDPSHQHLLQHAVRHGQLELLELYIAAGLPTNVTDENGYDLLHTAIFEDHAEVLTYLLGMGLRPGPLPEHDDRELKEVVRSKRVRRMLADIDRTT